MKGFRLSLVFVILLAGAALAGCGRKTIEVRVGPDSNKNTIEIQKGDTLLVELPAYSTNGYVWEIADIDASILKQTTEIYFPDGKNSDSPQRASKSAVVEFLAVNSGNTTVKLVYYRTFEPSAQSQNDFNQALSSSGPPPSTLGQDKKPVEVFSINVSVP